MKMINRIIMSFKSNDIKEIDVNANNVALAEITNDNIGNYIDLGNDILGTGSTSNNWRILYVENDRVYAILADYLPNSTGYAEDAGLDTYGKYGVYSSNSSKKLIERLTTGLYWKELANGVEGAEVTGTVTTELLLNSFNVKNGLELSYKDYPNLIDELLVDCDLYVPHAELNDVCYGYWITSPDLEDSNKLWLIRSNGCRSNSMYWTTNIAVRPVVSLPNTLMCENINGVWVIKQ